MAERYEKVKHFTAITTAILLSTSLLTGCGASTQTTASNSVQTATEQAAEEPEELVDPLDWTPLAELDTHADLRSSFEELTNILVTKDGIKSGILYTDSMDHSSATNQNNTLFEVYRNTGFNISAYNEEGNYIKDEDKAEKIKEIAGKEYTDIEDGEETAAVLNAYFELLPDESAGEFQGSKSLSRAQAMALVMRAITPVNEDRAPEHDGEFTKTAGDTVYTDYAAAMDGYAVLNTENGLDKETFNGSMSRGEYIALLVNSMYGEEYTERIKEAEKEDKSQEEKDTALKTIKDAGEISIEKAMEQPEKGMPDGMYEPVARAAAIGFITEEEINWEEALTKVDAIKLFMDAAETYYDQTRLTAEQLEAKGLAAYESGSTDDYKGGEVDHGVYGDYPDDNPAHMRAWDTFCTWYQPSAYGTTLKGKGQSDLPPTDYTGYDATKLIDVVTDKGYNAVYDTSTGMVYYSGMTTPDGFGYCDMKSAAAIANYLISQGPDRAAADGGGAAYAVTYEEMQEVLGTYTPD